MAIDSKQAAQLLEANEQLVLAMLSAQTKAESVERYLNEVSRSAEHDALTQLPNRVLLLDRFAQAIASARRHRARLALLFLDLNGFKQINDTHGHAVGDMVLKLVANRLTSAVRKADTVSRHGGDEFLILLTEVSQPTDAIRIADKIVAALGVPGRVGEHRFRLTASIGITIYPDDGDDCETLINRADAAMYQAKRQGRGSYVLHGEEASRALAPRPLPPARQTLVFQQGPNDRLQEANRQLLCAVSEARDLQAAAEQAQRQQTEFMVLLAHDLSTPLMPPHSTVAELERIGADQPLLGQAQDVLRAHDFEIASIVREAIDTSRPAMDARQQHLSVQIPDGHLRVHGDPVRLTQALCNLLENASNYTQMGGQIGLSVTLIEERIQVTVSDNGRGIRASTLPRIFEPFVRDPESSTGGALGLGFFFFFFFEGSGENENTATLHGR